MIDGHVHYIDGKVTKAPPFPFGNTIIHNILTDVGVVEVKCGRYEDVIMTKQCGKNIAYHFHYTKFESYEVEGQK